MSSKPDHTSAALAAWEELVCENGRALIDQVDALGSVSLNGQHLGDIPAGAGPTRFEITILLQQRNQLEVVVDLPMTDANSAPLKRPNPQQRSGGLIGEVKIEIQSLTES